MDSALSGIPISGAEPQRHEQNVEYQGIPTSRGIGIGTIYRLDTPLDLEHLDYMPSSDPEREVLDLMEAIAEARRDLDGRRGELGAKFGLDLAAVFQIHIQILEDKGFVSKLRDETFATGNALEALTNVLAAYKETFNRIADPYFRERVTDIEDVGQRVMESLIGERHHVTLLSDGAVVVVNNILPGTFARLELDKISAIVSEHGGPTSHGAIFARTLEIPDPNDEDDAQRIPDFGVGRPLTLGERKSLARRPDRDLIARVMRDPNPDVIRILLNNPGLTESDVVRVCARRPVPCPGGSAGPPAQSHDPGYPAARRPESTPDH